MAITAVLHILLLAAILIYHSHVRSERQETILILPITTWHPPLVEHKHVKPPHRRGGIEAHIGPVILPHGAISAAPLHALHGLLFDCTEGKLATMSAEDRARCAHMTGGMNPNDSVDYADHTNRAHNAARWARAVARKQVPALLPCANPQGVDFVYTALCLAKSALQGGFGDLDAQPGYADKPESFHLPNNGDPQRPRQPPY